MTYSQLVGVVIDGLYLGKEAVVHVHAVALFGEHGQQILGEFLHLLGVVTATECIEHSRHLVQDAAAVVQGQDGVLEVGGCLNTSSMASYLTLQRFMSRTRPWHLTTGGAFISMLGTIQVPSVTAGPVSE